MNLINKNFHLFVSTCAFLIIFSTLCVLFLLKRLLVSKIIVSSNIEDELNEVLSNKIYKNSLIKNLDLEDQKLQITKKYTKYIINDSKNNDQKKVLIFFPGSDIEEYKKILSHINNIKQNNGDRFDEIIIPHYPKQCISFSSIGKNGKKVINDLLKNNYKPENIDIFGYSFGVSVANSVVDSYKKKFKDKNLKFNSIIHYNGFSNVNNTAKEKINKIVKLKFLQKILKCIMSFCILGFHFNNAKIIENKNFPVKKQIVVSSEKDINIPKNISLSEKINNTKNKNIEIYESKNSDHFDIKYKQIFDILDTKEIHDENFVKKS